MQTKRGVQWEARGKNPALAAPGKSGGFLYHYGPQAWIDMVMSHAMILRRAWPVISCTFLPILRLRTAAERIDRGCAEIRSRRETVRIFDSPRERWRIKYGNFVREAEWALLELRKHFTPARYEDLVIGTSVALAVEFDPHLPETSCTVRMRWKAHWGETCQS
jgi:hypothetical protein